MKHSLKIFLLIILVNSTNAIAQSENAGKLKTIVQMISDHYTDTLDTKLTDSIARALLISLDPHSVYFNTVEIKEFNDQLHSKFEGIGVVIDIIEDTVFVKDVLDGGPALKTGLLAGDRIVKIDNSNMVSPHLSFMSVISKLKGTSGTKVNVTVVRLNEKQDCDRALITGRRSFGKGLVQNIFSLPDSSAIKLTTSRYYTPSGRCIQKPYITSAGMNI